MNNKEIYVVWEAGKPETAHPLYDFRSMSVAVNGMFGKFSTDQPRKYFIRIDGPIDPELSPQDIAEQFEVLF